MEEQRNVKWIVIVSLVLLFFSVSFAPSFFLGYYTPTPPRDVWYYINRLDILFFIATITTATLFVINFGKKELTYKLTAYLFITSMGLFFLSFSKLLFM